MNSPSKNISMVEQDWFYINNHETLDSPSLVLYMSNLEFNIKKIISMVDGETNRLMIHVKTNKMPEVIKYLINQGIKNFKASTIAEAEIAAMQGADSVLIAHQLVGPKIKRFINLIKHFPKTEFSTLVDNIMSVKHYTAIAENDNIHLSLFIDINNGMHRSGIELGENLNQLIHEISLSPNLDLKGLHVYDGHIRLGEFQKRKDKVESDLKPVIECYQELKQSYSNLQLVCGGTPSFTCHLYEIDRTLSPGTCVLWDWGYHSLLKEQDFKFAALVISRVISKPTKGIITIDLGHKAIAAENSIDKRIKFLNLSNYKLLSQSEEHGVLEVGDWDNIRVGDVLYGIPYHICPTVNLYDKCYVIENKAIADSWEILGRKRKLSI